MIGDQIPGLNQCIHVTEKWLGGPMKKCCKGGMTVDWLSSWFTGILIFPSYFFQIMFTQWWHWQGEKQKRYYTVFEKDIRKAVCCQFGQTAKNQSSQVQRFSSSTCRFGVVQTPKKKKIFSPIFFTVQTFHMTRGSHATRGLVAAREMKLGAFAKPVRAACLGAGVRYFVVVNMTPFFRVDDDCIC